MNTSRIRLMSMLLAMLAAVPAGAQSLVGAWSADNTAGEGATVVVFLSNGYYFLIGNARAADAPHATDGFERGTYAWNPASGAFTVATVQDLNGDDGLSGLGGTAGITVTVAGKVVTLNVPGEAPATATRVVGASPLVGAWFLGNPAVSNKSVVIVFLPNGIYFTAHDGDSSPSTGDPTGHDGIEHGTYSWDPVTGLVTSSRAPAPFVDTNGDWGLSHPSSGFFARVAGDTLTVTENADVFVLTRVGAALAPAPATVVEYYHAAFDHYFITASADEIGKLDAGVFAGWARTGQSFSNYALNAAGAANVCRFFSTSFAPKSSHFYTPSASECAIVKNNADWLYEDVVFAVALPDSRGRCPAGTHELYRLYNDGQGAAPNHRYTTNFVVRATMIAAGWIPEGEGALGVIGCVPA